MKAHLACMNAHLDFEYDNDQILLQKYRVHGCLIKSTSFLLCFELQTCAIRCFGMKLSHVYFLGNACDDGPLQDCLECGEYIGE
jgi:hypothetical protein